MTDLERQRLAWVRARIARIHKLQRSLTKQLTALDNEQAALAILLWEHENSYKLCRTGQDFTDRDAEQLLRRMFPQRATRS